MRVAGQTAAAIAASLERSIHTGRTRPGTALPTVRELAATLGVSPATVAAAYRLLRDRGLTAGQGRRGTRIAARSTTLSVVAPTIMPGTVDLALGNPDPALLPPLEPALHGISLAQRLYGAVPSGPLATFAAAEFENDGVPAASVVVSSGALDAIERILSEHLRLGDRVAVEDPSYPGIRELISGAGFTVVPFGVDENGPLPDSVQDALKRGARAIIVTPRAHNPTGAAVSPQRAAELRRILRGSPDLVLIENDYAAPIAGVPLVTLQGACERWAVVRSTSKFLGPDLRVAVMAADELTAARVARRHALGARWVSHILQQLVMSLWSDPASGRLLARAAAIYAQRRNGLRAALEARDIAAYGRSGFNLWVPVRDEARVVRALAEDGWAVAPGEPFRITAGPAIRITTSALAPADAERLADDLASALRPVVTSFA
jgi:DNA-binding transcriptional MocR family regulator